MVFRVSVLSRARSEGSDIRALHPSGQPMSTRNYCLLCDATLYPTKRAVESLSTGVTEIRRPRKLYISKYLKLLSFFKSTLYPSDPWPRIHSFAVLSSHAASEGPVARAIAMAASRELCIRQRDQFSQLVPSQECGVRATGSRNVQNLTSSAQARPVLAR